MDPRFAEVDRLLHAALERDASERSAFLRAATGDDSALFREVTSLLAAHEREAPFLDAPAHGGAARLLDLDPGAAIDDPVGARLGPYRIVRPLASGGMGAVYLGERDDDAYRQTVAIKLVRRSVLGSSSARRGDVERRFRIERQVLANLDSPNIARLIDGGTSADGRPYFVMEYVEGRPIDAYCDEAGLDLRARAELLVRVCAAVEHAHQRGVIHRDLKPSNILVTGAGEPKLLDFGLAKLLDPHGAAAAGAATMTGAFMGTFAYAAPEQVTDTGGAPDTRSDVYALGMLLYRLVSGRGAYDVEGPLSDVLRRITVEPPPAPSTVTPGVDDDLDVIILTALQKDPARRYASVGDLRQDLERWRSGEPILARADSGWYVLRRTLRRYRAALVVAAAFLVLVTAFAVVASIQATRLGRERANLAEALRVSNIERGRALGLAGSTALAEDLLWRAVLDERDAPAAAPADRLAHWALWELYRREPCLATRTIGLDIVGAVAMPDDESWLAAAGDDGRLVVVDPADGRRILEHRTDGRALFTMAAAPDGRRLALGAAPMRVDVLDVPSGTVALRLEHEHPVVRVAYGAGGGQLVVLTTAAIVIRDAATGAVRRTIPCPESGCLAVAPDGSRLAAGGRDGLVRVFDAGTGALETELSRPGRRCGAVCFSGDGRLLATDRDGTIVDVYEVPSWRPVTSVDDATGWITQLAFRPGRAEPWMLAATGYDKRVLAWEIPSGRRLLSWHAHEATVQALRFLDGGRLALSAASEPAVRTWEMDADRARSRWPDRGSVFGVACTSDGSRVVTVSGDESALCLRDAADGAILDRVPGGDAILSSAALSADGRRLVTAGYDSAVRAWSIEPDDTFAPLWELAAAEGMHVSSVAWSPEGDEIASAGDGAVIRLHRAEDGAVRETIEADGVRIPSVRFSPDGRWLAAAVIQPNAVLLVDRRSGERLELPARRQPVRVVRFSTDGSMLAAGGDDLEIQLWSLPGHGPPRLLRVLRGHQQDVFAVAFSPDGTMLASGGRAGEIRLWSVASGHGLATLPGHDDMLFNLVFTPDGRRVLSGGRDRAVNVWDLTYYDRHIAGNEAYWRERLGR